LKQPGIVNSHCGATPESNIEELKLETCRAIWHFEPPLNLI